MARPMQMPPKADLPEGPHRAFVELLFDYYRRARRPTLEKICTQIQSKDRAGTASRETVRRMLRGQTIPPNWQTVEAVFAALCELAGVDPDRKVKVFNSFDEDEWTPADRRSQMEAAWNAALDGRIDDRPEFQGIDFETAVPVNGFGSGTGGFGGGGSTNSSSGFGSGGFGGSTSARAPFKNDPWGSTSKSQYSDDPPF
ncbi:helix-turn-helix domain-containing protein [Actinomadura sp. WAC 06369]|uniref:helix-turn-helix domain-containing protein n=1 Tax=Actinomadura sp. WAC 06369 TaxID=2203193 RepID=UPI000F781DB3|nr:helix-turn-helix domain-containing protein [Actinomadura sp. WAC 06369]